MSRVFLLIPLNFVAAGVLTYGLNHLAARLWRAAASAHWTERARLLWPVRVAKAIHLLLIPICLSLGEIATQQETWTGCAWPAVAGLLGSVLASYPLDRVILPRLTPGSWLRMTYVAWLMRLGFWAVVVAGAVAMPEQADWRLWAIGGGVLLFMLAWNWGLWLLVLRRVLGVLHRPDERLRGIVIDTARQMEIREPVTWLLDLPLAQAFAAPTRGELLFSSRLMEICSDEEVSAICAHELAHLSEPRSVLIRRIAGSLIFYPLVFVKPATESALGGLAMMGSVFVLIMVRRKLSRNMEERADKIAAESQANPTVYGHTLEKLYCDSALPAVGASNVRSHPHLYDRMLAAGVQPDYPRPAKPSRMPWFSYLIWAVYAVLFWFALSAGN